MTPPTAIAEALAAGCALADEAAFVDAILSAAWSWVGTPWRHAASVRGLRGGVDCGRFLVAVYQAVGLIPADAVVPPYAPNWFLFRDDHVIEPLLARFGTPAADPAPGDVVTFQVGRAAIGHCGIVTSATHMLHAHPDDGVVETIRHRADLVGRYTGAWRAHRPWEAA